ncbi:hypothetical protein ASPZODRAFT_15546 [Penicilliopsis zonata CBS 506.65]|uniref:Zn(2)-C6 fungal-type domain-containing protein n=1 Tax=Penicilliopsis zonata CBS 506.65 TaxID=1073090 RepID=A0A1L9SIJ4_9EURO|nr:hypothetical protein ASPZODRAFT_15546 [Penicilliopsis zonata CBS 506.65]OJJ46854.1 hypothetical protein ASPZODRAFT_15546 [Penicilliopsis zonata CBS 506.65]
MATSHAPGALRDGGGTVTPTLSCESCRQRKIKCDKLMPCSHCRKAGIICESVQRKRLPRGRYARNSNHRLREKIEKLETLVNAALASAATPTSGTNLEQVQQEHPSIESGQNKPLALDFCNDLLKEIQGLHGLTHVSEEDESNPSPEVPETLSESLAPRPWSLPWGYAGAVPFQQHQQSLALRPSAAVTARLCEIYLSHVDRIIKVLHRPSLREHLLEDRPYRGFQRDGVAEAALDAAVFYAAVASMTDRQCQALFHCAQSAVLPEYQIAAEMALQRADLMRTESLLVLQALVIYLVATRVHDRTRAVWTMVATAVRIAQALNLHLESSHPLDTFFHAQLRKRLWFVICLLDAQVALDQGSKPLITHDMAQGVSLPANVNDEDIDPSYPAADVVAPPPALTDMTLSLVIYNLQTAGRSIHIPGRDVDNEHVREAMARFESTLSSLTQHCNPAESPYSWLVYYSARSLVSSMRLSVLRPLVHSQEQSHNQNQHPAPRMPGDSQASSLLELCEGAIENSYRMETDARGEGFRWYVSVQWTSLAITLLECYTSPDIGGVKRLWPLVECVFEHYCRRHSTSSMKAVVRILARFMESTRERVQMLTQGTDSQQQQQSVVQEAYSDTVDPSWSAWEEFTNELVSSGDFDEAEWAGDLFVRPDMVFPS